MSKKAILSISFGTNNPETMEKNLSAIEEEYRKDHPGIPIYRALTNEAAIESLKLQGEGSVYAIREALAKMVLDEVTHIYAQPAYILNGVETEAMREMLFSHKADFVSVRCGDPLLHSIEDCREVCEALMEDFEDLPPQEGVVLIGHGSRHFSNTVYCTLDYLFKDLGYENTHMGTFNAYPQIDQVIRHLRKSGIRKVYLKPFMTVAGDVAMEGVCGDGENSMKSRLEEAGIEAIPFRQCLGENARIRRVFADHLNQIMK